MTQSRKTAPLDMGLWEHGLSALAALARECEKRSAVNDQPLSELNAALGSLEKRLANLQSHDVCELIEVALTGAPVYSRSYDKRGWSVYRAKLADIPDIAWHGGAVRAFETVAEDWLDRLKHGGFKGIAFSIRREYTGLYLYWDI